MSINYLGLSSIVGLIALAAVFHKKLTPYPDLLEPSDSPKRELVEVGVLAGIYFVSISVFIHVAFVQGADYPAIPLGPVSLSLHTILALILPVVVEVGFHRRGATDLGLGRTWHWQPGVAALLFGVLWGGIPAFFSQTDPISPVYLAYYLLTPAFVEEFVYRGVFQAKLERGFQDHTKAWVIGGLLFGLMHVPTDFFGPIWVRGGRNYVNSVVALVTQVLSGFIWGILYAKTRHLVPLIASHYLLDFLPGILAHVM